MRTTETRPDNSTLEKPVASAYWETSRVERRKSIKNMNLLIAWGNQLDGDFVLSQDTQLHTTVDSLKKAGFAPVSDKYIMHGFAYIFKKDNLDIPYQGQYRRKDDLKDDPVLKRKVAQERKSLVDYCITRLRLEKQGNEVRFIEVNSEGEQDITENIFAQASGNAHLVAEFSSYYSFVGETLNYLKKFVAENKGLAVFTTNNKIDQVNPMVGIDPHGNINEHLSRQIEAIYTEKSVEPRLSVFREAVRFGQIVAKRDQLKETVDQGIVDTVPAFERNKWPRHGLMTHIKDQVEPYLENAINEAGIVCDPLDAQYQVIFRLTTYSLADLFTHGEELQRYVSEQGVYQDWRKILTLDKSVYGAFSINPDLIHKVVDEQLRLTAYRMQRSSLPVDEIVIPSGIFAETGWEIKKKDGSVMAIKKGSNGKTEEEAKVDFRVVPNELAHQIHADLHYIHTPRAALSFGLFLDGEEFPFSVLAMEPVDRSYKQNTLLLFGFDPRYCLDFTRLYSRPGTPKNTSSAIFGEAFSYIRTNYPHIEAAISSFMPSYASGLSMLTGGFEVPILIKPNEHAFSEVKLDDGIVMEHVTKRRQQNREEAQLTSTFPLLPVVELLSPLKQPRFEPVLQAGKEMVSLMK